MNINSIKLLKETDIYKSIFDHLTVQYCLLVLGSIESITSCNRQKGQLNSGPTCTRFVCMSYLQLCVLFDNNAFALSQSGSIRVNSHVKRDNRSYKSINT
jgi:hypothetical protein